MSAVLTVAIRCDHCGSQSAASTVPAERLRIRLRRAGWGQTRARRRVDLCPDCWPLRAVLTPPAPKRRCTARESGGFQCELEPHGDDVQHWISERTIQRSLAS